jgi:hypothetical protein
MLLLRAFVATLAGFGSLLQSATGEDIMAHLGRLFN